MSLQTVNLLWQLRQRGLLPAAARGIDDSGRALLVRPDEFERRTYQVLAAHPDGRTEERAAVSVETLYQLEGSPDGTVLLGMANDDLYLFREGRKTRVVVDRTTAYLDVALARDSGSFVTAFSDGHFAAYTIALGDSSGRLIWTRQAESPLNRVSISADGRIVLAGLQDGRIVSLDNMRQQRWTCLQEEPVTALSLAPSGRAAAVGTEAGSVMLLDDEGGFTWRAPVGVPVSAVAVDGAGTWVTAALSAPGDHRILCLGPEGAPVWEHSVESPPTGLAQSPNGRFMLATLADGTAACFELDFSGLRVASAAARREQALAEPEEARPPEETLAALASLLAEAPHDLEVASRHAAARDAVVSVHRERAGELEAAGQSAEALAELDAALALDRWNIPLIQERLACRERAAQELAERAASAEGEREWDVARHAWLAVLGIDPDAASAREGLLRVRRAQAEEWLAEADTMHAEGQDDRAVALWSAAREIESTPELEERLRAAEARRCLATGIARYEEGRIPEAAFNLRRVLVLDPDCEEAERYLGYCRSRGTDTTIGDRFARLE